MIKLKDLLEWGEKKSQAAMQAAELGLIAKPYGKYADPNTGEIVAMSVNGQLVQTQKHKDQRAGGQSPQDKAGVKKGVGKQFSAAASNPNQVWDNEKPDVPMQQDLAFMQSIKNDPYEIVDSQTGQVVGTYQGSHRAHNKADKLDQEYGGYRFMVRRKQQ